MKLIKQRLGKLVDEGRRIYLQDRKLALDTCFKPGQFYKYVVNVASKLIKILPADDGVGNTVSKRILPDGSLKSVIDIRDRSIHNALIQCDYITITIFDEMVEIRGHIDTATALREQPKEGKVTAIQFFAGSGISSETAKRVGFEEIAFIEFNSHGKNENSWDRYSDLCERNHPNSISFNVPIEKLSADILPKANVWLISLPCNDYSNIKRKKRIPDAEYEKSTRHYFLHLMRLFYQTVTSNRPEALFVEQVPGFKSVAGESVEAALRDEGYYVTSEVIDSADFGARTMRKRYYMVASVYERFEWPIPTGRVKTPLIREDWFNLDDIEWKTPDTSDSLKYLYTRQQGKTSSEVFTIKAIDPSKDAIAGTIPKYYKLSSCLALVRHPEVENCWGAFTVEQLRKLHRVWNNLYLGESVGLQRECIGQAIECGTVFAIFKQLYDHLLSVRHYGQLALFAGSIS